MPQAAIAAALKQAECDESLADNDDGDKTMGELIKDRGVNDCGSIGNCKWSSTEFELQACWVKSDCDGEALVPDDQYQLFPKRP